VLVALAIALALQKAGDFGSGTRGQGTSGDSQSNAGTHLGSRSATDDATTGTGVVTDNDLNGGTRRKADETGAESRESGNVSSDLALGKVDRNAAPVQTQEESTSDRDGRTQNPQSARTTPDKVQSFSTFGGIQMPSVPRNSDNGSDNVEGDGEISFFGVEGKGSTIIYVIDMSGSMAGYRLERAKKELWESVKHLNRSQSFCILFFHGQMVAPMGVQVARATPAIKRKTWDALSLVEAFDGTDPSDAVQAAISLRPDVIYVLSDGEFEPEAVPAVASMNKDAGIIINTIGFQIDAQSLRQIAQENRGEYRFIP
jgi:hypothetical protein